MQRMRRKNETRMVDEYGDGYAEGYNNAILIIEGLAKQFVGNTQADGTRSSEVYFYGIGCERAVQLLKKLRES
jgi:hypothetical protein